MKSNCIALIGRICSGKTTVSAFFKTHGFAIIDADMVAREVVLPGTGALGAIHDYFGDSVISSNGTLNRKMLCSIIFKSPQQKKWLEALLHPLIRQSMEQQVLAVKDQPTLLEIPLLTDKSQYPYINQVIYLTCDRVVAIKRLMKRDGCDRQHAESIIDVQPSDAQYVGIADMTIENNGSKQQLITKLDKTLNQFLQS